MSSNQWLRFLMFVIIVMNAKKHLWQKKNTNVLQNVFLFFSRIMSRWIRPFHALQKMPHIFQPKLLWQSQKQSLWQSTKKCLKCEKIISRKFVEGHLCGFFRRLKLQEICSQRTSLMFHEKKAFQRCYCPKNQPYKKKKLLFLQKIFQEMSFFRFWM